ncbi:MAG: hypothetical protein KDB73_16680, partial [Planctomycetes bacterium]|nr:hypothetical protein [Planctomycetota bacterium]
PEPPVTDRGIDQPGDGSDWDQPTGTTPDAVLAVPPQPSPTAEAPATAHEAKAAVAALRKGLRAKADADQAAALAAAGDVNDESIVKEIGKALRKERAADVRRVAYDTLRRYLHVPYRERAVDALLDALEREVDRERSRIAKADPGVRIDPRTGDDDTYSPEGQAVYEATARAGRAMATLLTGLLEAGWSPDARKDVDMSPLLQCPDDVVVVSALKLIAVGKDERALPEMLELFRQYPEPARYETGGVVDRGGTNATAKAAWMVRFGHPDKRRARPHVHAALRAAVLAVLGRDVHTPDRLESLIRARD